MRTLTLTELTFVSGGCGQPTPPTCTPTHPEHPEHPEHPTKDCTCEKQKGNNGFGNGGGDGVPGNSGKSDICR